MVRVQAKKKGVKEHKGAKCPFLEGDVSRMDGSKAPGDPKPSGGHDMTEIIPCSYKPRGGGCDIQDIW